MNVKRPLLKGFFDVESLGKNSNQMMNCLRKPVENPA